MTLRTRAVIASALVALPAAFLVTSVVESWRSRDLALALRRVVRSQINEQVRERCESEPNWFLTGPLLGRPLKTDPPPLFPELAPRPKLTDQPFELFPYDQELLGSSVAAPKFPNELRRPIRQSGVPAEAPFVTPQGTGVQIAMSTDWVGSPCAILLGRMRPPPNEQRNQYLLMAGVAVTVFVAALAALTQTVFRVRRLAADALESPKDGWSSIAPDKRRDEIAAIAFVFNDALKEMHLRDTEIKDRDDAMRRLTTSMLQMVTTPLETAETHLQDGRRSEALSDVALARTRLRNLIAAARLRSRLGVIGSEAVDFTAATSDAVERLRPLAEACGVKLTATLTRQPITVTGDAILIEQVVENLVDNGIRHVDPGAHVDVVLEARGGDGRFSFRVSDNGRRLSGDEIKSLGAIRRFRGDEGRERRAGVPGLGLAVAREIAERAGWRMDLRRSANGGLEAEVAAD